MANNLMEEMRERYYPYHNNTDQSRNLQEALEIIKCSMERGETHIDMWDHWTDLPDDWVVETETLDELKKQGFRVVKRWCDKGDIGEHYWYIIAWDDFNEWSYDEEYETHKW